jgi:hypothetical protein
LWLLAGSRQLTVLIAGKKTDKVIWQQASQQTTASDL